MLVSCTITDCAGSVLSCAMISILVSSDLCMKVIIFFVPLGPNRISSVVSSILTSLRSDVVELTSLHSSKRLAKSGVVDSTCDGNSDVSPTESSSPKSENESFCFRNSNELSRSVDRGPRRDRLLMGRTVASASGSSSSVDDTVLLLYGCSTPSSNPHAESNGSRDVATRCMVTCDNQDEKPVDAHQNPTQRFCEWFVQCSVGKRGFIMRRTWYLWGGIHRQSSCQISGDEEQLHLGRQSPWTNISQATNGSLSTLPRRNSLTTSTPQEKVSMVHVYNTRNIPPHVG